MSLIQTVDPDKAEGQTKEIYDIMQRTAGVIPSPLQLASASPWMIDMVWRSIQFYTNHPNLSFGVLSSIRYLVAKQNDYAYCTGFNRNFLKMQGMTDEDIEKIEADPGQVPLDDKDRAMVSFVVKAIHDPDSVQKTDMDTLRDHGWQDNDILEALSHGANMIASSIMMKAFKMDQEC